ncbi:MAG: 5-bromo-4-chloroindolyl phosphate hydrolysis family protein [Clostridia bacterium]|mgnify:CR=1 FL=1|nr:5-bromo-4-chloroindolyl phosphate hydrolysis family protein [Clostridia bacterium]
MKKGYILSAIVGGACFAVPFCLEIATMPVSLLFGVLGYGAGTLMFSDSKTNMTLGKNNENLVDVLNNAKKMNSAILNMINKVEDDVLKQDIRAIYQTANKIINTVSKDNKKVRNVENFFTYYLPETLNLLKKYDEIENQRLGKASEEFMKKTRDMVSKIKDSFNQQLAHLYQEDIIDTNAEMKVFDSMIKSDGYGDSDFKL